MLLTAVVYFTLTSEPTGRSKLLKLILFPELVKFEQPKFGLVVPIIVTLTQTGEPRPVGKVSDQITSLAVAPLPVACLILAVYSIMSPASGLVGVLDITLLKLKTGSVTVIVAGVGSLTVSLVAPLRNCKLPVLVKTVFC